MRGCLRALIALVLLPGPALGAEASISVEAPAGGCPAAGQVSSGLEARLPGVTRARAGPRSGPRYRLEIDRGATAEVRLLRLREVGGGSVLERRLTVPGASHGPARSPEGCQAIAEAAALVVVRFLREIGYRSPRPVRPPDEPAPAPAAEATPPAGPPAAPTDAAAPAPATSTTRSETPSLVDRLALSGDPLPAASAASAATIAAVPAARPRLALFLGAGGGARIGLAGGARTELLVGLQGERGWLGVELAGGVTSETAREVPGSGGSADLRVRAFPLRAALGFPLPLLGGVIAPAVGLDVDLLAFQARGLVDAQGGVRVEPSAALGLAYRAAGRRLFVRGSLWGGFSLAPRDFDAGLETPVFRTPTAHLRVVIETGLTLWKN